MSQPNLGHDLTRRYLDLLELSQRKPCLAALRQLVAAHLARIPFENISKLHYLAQFGLCGIPDINMYLDGIKRFHFGGTCYSNNFHFYSLLASLGYEVKLCGADMSQPDVHMVIITQCEGREFLIDVGYAAPFVAPLPRDLASNCVVQLGRDRYVLKPQDENGCSRLELYRDGVLKHGYLVKPSPKRLEDFREVIAGSFDPSATFRHSLLLTKFDIDRAVMIHNLNVIESDENMCSIRAVAGRPELVMEIEKRFGIPKSITEPVLAELDLGGDAWG